MKLFRGYLRLLHLWESKNGRDAGWNVEIDGRPVAKLSDCKSSDMFWDSYRLEVLEDAPKRGDLGSDSFWGEGRSCLRNRRFGEIAPNAIVRVPESDPTRIFVRGAYLEARPPNMLDQLVLAIRRWMLSAKARKH